MAIASQRADSPDWKNLLARAGDAQVLAQFDADPTLSTQVDSMGERLIHAAARENRTALIEAFVNRGVPVDVISEPRHMDVEFTGRLVVGPDTPLLSAVSAESLGAVRTLLRLGADPNVRSDTTTPLCIAAGMHFTEIARALLNAGADPNRGDASDSKPLHAAVWSRSEDIVELLISQKADVDSKCNKGRSPLCCCTIDLQLGVMKLLLAAGSKPNHVDENGRTPLHHAARAPKLVEQLLAAGAKPNILDSALNSPLHLAVCIPESVAALLAGGADPNQVGPAGRTPAHDAAYLSSPKVLALLAGAGADFTIRSITGQSPLDFAMDFRRPENAAWIRAHHA